MVSNWDVVLAPAPELKPDQSVFADKAYVAEWISRLPLAASGKAAENIRTALENVTSYQLHHAARLSFLEKTSPITTSLMQVLLQGLHQEGLPLQPKTAERARLLLEILALKVVGYRQVIDSLTCSLLAGGLRRRHLVGTCMMRVMELLGQMLEIYRYACTPPGRGLWRLFNRYYAIAEADRQVDTRYERIQGIGKSTIAAQFKTQVMLDGLNYHDLRYNELEQARVLLGSMADHVSITETGDVTQPHYFCFRIDEDAPPSRFAPERKRQCESSPMRRVMNLGAMMAMLKKLQKTRTGAGGVEAVNQVVARKLYEGWLLKGDGRDEREDKEHSIRIAFGLSNIVAALAEAYSDPIEFELDEEEAIVMEQREGAHLTAAGIDGIDASLHKHRLDEERDVWSIVPYTGAERDSWSDEYRREMVSQIFDGLLVNESPGGFGVTLARDASSSRFKAGDLVGLEIDGDWVLASIRWVRSGQDSVALGLARLGARLQPFSLVVQRDGKESQPLPVILLRHYKGDAAIVLHNLNLRADQRVGFSDTQTLSVDNQLESTPSFVCYRVEDEVYEELLRASVMMREEQALTEPQADQETLEREWHELLAEQKQKPSDQPSGYDMLHSGGFD